MYGGMNMQKRTMKRLLIIEFMIIVLLLMYIFWEIKYNTDNVELLHEISPDGDYVLIIEEFGKPVFPFYPALIKVIFYSHEQSYSVVFNVDVVTRDGTVQYGIEWLEDGVRIILSGKESHYYILPFKTLEDSRKLL